MTLSLLAILAASVGVTAILRMLETDLVTGELVRREIVPVRGDRCSVQGVYRITVDGATYEHVVHSEIVNRTDEVAMRAAIRALTPTLQIRWQPDAPEVMARADGAAVPVLVQRQR